MSEFVQITKPTRHVGTLEVYVPPKLRFMRKFERFEPVIQDHSAVIVAKRCKREYFFRIVLGRVPKKEPQYFGFGSCYHKFREVLERQYMGCEDKVARTMPDRQLAFFGIGLQAAIDLWEKKKMKDPDPDDRFAFMTKARMIESCSVAFKYWMKEKLEGRIEVLAAEQNFVVPLPGGLIIGGKADQIIKWNGKIWGRDFKTSSKNQDKWFARMLDPNDQFMRYTVAESALQGTQFGLDDKGHVTMAGVPVIQGQLVEVMFNAKNTKKEKKGPAIFNHIAARSASQLAMWIEEQIAYSKMFLDPMRDNDMYPAEEHHCNYCDFHSVCKSASEMSMTAKLESEFSVRPWDCQARGEVDID